ncbi:MAG: sulfotransferase [Planctomycetota bacterium]
MIVPLVLMPSMIWTYAGDLWKVQFLNAVLAERIDEAQCPRIWVDGTEYRAEARHPDHLLDRNEYGCVWYHGHFIFRLPADMDPRDPRRTVIIGAPLAIEDLQCAANWQSRPVWIVGPQRSGTTALGWALGHGSSIGHPRHLVNPSHHTEGYLLRQALGPFAFDPLLASQVGQDFSPRQGHDRTGALRAGFATGIFAGTGAAGLMLYRLAAMLEAAMSDVSRSTGRWLEKSPGREALMTLPLAHALFPNASTLLLTREPGTCVRSQLRFQNVDLRSVPTDESLLQQLATWIAGWMFLHHYWRHVVAPFIPAAQRMVIPFSLLRKQPEEAVHRIASMVGLQPEEEQGVLNQLSSAPVAVHRQAKTQETIELESLITCLAWPEGAHWAESDEPPVMPTIDSDLKVHLCRGIRNAGKSFFREAGFDGEYADLVVSYWYEDLMADRTPSRASVLARDEGLESARPGLLLKALMDVAEANANLAAGAHGRSEGALRVSGWTLLQRYEGTSDEDLCSPGPKQLTGRFWDSASDDWYPWSAEIADPQASFISGTCRCNGHPGTISLSADGQQLSGLIRMGGRTDRLEGEVVGATSVRLTRWISNDHLV